MNRGPAASGASIVAAIFAVSPMACSPPLREGQDSAAAATSGTGGTQVATAAQGGQGGATIVITAPACTSTNGDASSPAACSDGGSAYASTSDAGAAACPCLVFVDGSETLSGTPCDEFGLLCEYRVSQCLCSNCWTCYAPTGYRASVLPVGLPSPAVVLSHPGE